MHRQRYRRISPAPQPAHTPFQLLPLDFPLSPTTFAHLTTTQLALAWIAPHPDWVEQTHWNLLFAEWRKRRREREGAEREWSGRQGEKEEEDPMHCLRLDWKIPDKLEELDSGPLAALPMHPDFHPLLVEEARRVFRERRERDLPRHPSQPKKKPPRRPRQQSPLPDHDNSKLIPRDFTSHWTTIFIGSVVSTMPHSVVWAMLSPSDLPEPVAISLIPPKPKSSKKPFSLCFVAYESRREALEACRGLYDTQYGDGENRYRLVAELTDKPAHAVAWEWITAREDFRERFEPGYFRRRKLEEEDNEEPSDLTKEDEPFPTLSRPLSLAQHITPEVYNKEPSPPSQSLTSLSDEALTSSSPTPLPPPSPPSTASAPLLGTFPSEPSVVEAHASNLSITTQNREEALRAMLLARKRDREVKEQEQQQQQREESNRSLLSLSHDASPGPVAFVPFRPPSRPKAMRLAGFDHALPPQPQPQTPAFPSSPIAPRSLAPLPQHTGGRRTNLATLRQAAMGSRLPAAAAPSFPSSSFASGGFAVPKGTGWGA